MKIIFSHNLIQGIDSPYNKSQTWNPQIKSFKYYFWVNAFQLQKEKQQQTTLFSSLLSSWFLAKPLLGLARQQRIASFGNLINRRTVVIFVVV